jgi:AcrR family transcriptional regulator
MAEAPELILRPATGHDRRRLRTRAKLLTAARALLSEKGIDTLQVAEVTKRAGVGIGSFYNHFASKEELADAVVAEALAQLTEAMVIGVSDVSDPAELVCDAVRRFVRLAYDDPGFAQLVVQVDRADALMDQAVYPDAGRALEAGMRSGRFDIDDLRLTLVSVLGGALALMREILAGRTSDGAETHFAEHTMRGLGVSIEECRALVARPLRPLQQSD